MSRKKRRNKKHNSLIAAFGIVAAVILVIMVIQIVRLKQRDAQYAEREAYLEQQYAEETERAEEIDALSDYVKTTKYIEDVAKSKLGLAYENEIIFKESEE